MNFQQSREQAIEVYKEAIKRLVAELVLEGQIPLLRDLLRPEMDSIYDEFVQRMHFDNLNAALVSSVVSRLDLLEETHKTQIQKELIKESAIECTNELLADLMKDNSELKAALEGKGKEEISNLERVESLQENLTETQACIQSFATQFDSVHSQISGLQQKIESIEETQKKIMDQINNPVEPRQRSQMVPFYSTAELIKFIRQVVAQELAKLTAHPKPEDHPKIASHQHLPVERSLFTSESDRQQALRQASMENSDLPPTMNEVESVRESPSPPRPDHGGLYLRKRSPLKQEEDVQELIDVERTESRSSHESPNSENESESESDDGSESTTILSGSFSSSLAADPSESRRSQGHSESEHLSENSGNITDDHINTILQGAYLILFNRNQLTSYPQMMTSLRQILKVGTRRADKWRISRSQSPFIPSHNVVEYWSTKFGNYWITLSHITSPQ